MNNESNLQHDKFYREVFSKKENLQDLLRNAMPDKYVNMIDIDSISLEKESLVEELGSHWTDMIVNAKMNGTDVKITLLIEHKASYDKFTLLQILKYLALYWNEEIKNGADPLTPIIPVLVYHGKNKWNSNNDTTMCFDTGIDSDLTEFIPKYKYILYDLNTVSDDDIKGNIEYMIAVRVMKHIYKNLLQSSKEALLLLSDYLKDKHLDNNLKSFINTLVFYIIKSEEIEPKDIDGMIKDIHNNELKEVVMTLEQKLEKRGEERGEKRGEERGEKRGEERGRQEGRQEGKLEIAKKMKDKNMPIELISEITGLSKEEIEKL